MAKKTKQSEKVDLYYMNEQQNKNNNQKIKEREKRIKQQKKIKSEEPFDIETEEVIQMTNRNKIKKEQQQRKKIEAQEIKRKARNKKIKFILKIFILLAIIIGGATFALVSPIFNIKEIQVLNNKNIPAETIISLSGLKIDQNIFRFRVSKSIENIKTNSYIESVKIHRKIPDTIQIEVKEREHKYSVDFLGQYAYINNQGYILEISETSKDKPIIQGISTKEEEIIVGKRLNDEDLEKLEVIIKIMDICKEYELDTKITSIDISNKNEYNMYLAQEQKKVHLGDNSNLSNKILYINSIIEQEKGKSGEIFANGDLNNKFRVYFRENLNV